MPLMMLTPGDFKEYAWCPRTVYFKYCMPVLEAETAKMRAGLAFEKKIDELEKRRGLAPYGVSGYSRAFNVSFIASVEGLSGRADMVLEGKSDIIPVDFKMSGSGLQECHEIQLYAYGLGLSETTGKPARRGFIYLLLQDRLEEIDFSREDLRERYVSSRQRILRMIESEVPPDPSDTAKCAECGYRNYCGDVFTV